MPGMLQYAAYFGSGTEFNKNPVPDPLKVSSDQSGSIIYIQNPD
jgi:hypothetical protein